MVDRDPARRSGPSDAQTLLGDAAHAMYPIGSNGASQAIIDARTLAVRAGQRSNVAEGVAAYEDIRRPRTTALTLSNRSMGPERVMQLAYERAPRVCRHRNRHPLRGARGDRGPLQEGGRIHPGRAERASEPLR